ncbi:GNAT family N-acetyltransferase [Parendozoicomonas haliclonae]|uniref:Acetyltransferase (GNAT) family protein n=1 Tax=Parendozoicomonas haliclonae TaxID=1960125 RepID=A0A1X7AQ47_9GAMM|nr:GNAT family N-acetyltransferase [Parendozoicomonas haliclonae]SMA50242.1 Acetyltransferase (GNAT) family protein [Parendozoicomonas haliclonae]
MSVIIREPVASDYEQWNKLFFGYQSFYRHFISIEVIDITWKRILDASHNVSGLVAEYNGDLIGLTHYLFHDSTWNNLKSCYLEDLYVSKQSRGTGAARLLIEGVEQRARDLGAFRLYWHTQEYNGAARSLYDSIMPPSSFMVYRKNL